MAGTEHADTQAELEASFCRTDPEVAAQFARVTFRGDNRADLDKVAAPTLVLQVRDDAIAPMEAGEFVRDHIDGAVFRVLETRGHTPHMSDPDQVIAAMEEFLGAPTSG